MQREIAELKKQHTEKIDALTEKYQALEFKAKTEVFIHGYALADDIGIDLVKTVKDIAGFLEVRVADSDIQKVRVIKRRANFSPASASVTVRARHSIIAVDFLTHALALQVVDAKKRWKTWKTLENFGKLLNNQLNTTTPDSPISISFPLDKESYALLLLTKSRAAEHNVKYVWTSSGYVFIRHADGAKALKIRNSAHLDSILPPLRMQPAPAPAQMDTSTPNT